MSPQREFYLRGYYDCTARAGASQSVEIRGLWTHIASSYRFLLDREDRLEAEERERQTRNPSAVSF
jgi:hypothetical protein